MWRLKSDVVERAQCREAEFIPPEPRHQSNRFSEIEQRLAGAEASAAKDETFAANPHRRPDATGDCSCQMQS